MTNGLILHYIIRVTLYSTGHSVYTNMVSAGRGLSDVVTGLGKMHGSKLFWVDIVKIPYTQVNKRICLFPKLQGHMHLKPNERLMPNMRLIMKGKN